MISSGRVPGEQSRSTAEPSSTAVGDNMESGGTIAQIAAITEAQLPLAAGLRACAEESTSFRDARDLRRLARLVEQGGSLDELVKTSPRRSRMLWTLVAAGASLGRLPQLLESYLVVTRRNRAVWRRFWLSLLYPVLVLWAGVSLLLLALLLVVPIFRDMFVDFAIELPLLTIGVIRLSDHLWATWPVYAAGSLTLAALAAASPWLPVLAWWEWLPFVGAASKRAGAAEFCGLLSVLVDADAPLHSAVRHISSGLRNSRLGRSTRLLAQRLEQGTPPQEAADSVPGLPMEIKNAFRWAADRDQFTAVLRESARVLSAQARVSVLQMTFFVEPVCIVLLGTVAGLVMISLFLPLYKLLNYLT